MRIATAIFACFLLVMSFAGCVVTNPQPDYPGNWPPPEGGPLPALNHLNESLDRMFSVVNQFGPDAYQDLRRDMRDMNVSLNDVIYRMQRGERPNTVRPAYSNVQRASSAVDARIRSINADYAVRQAWNDVLSNQNYATNVMNHWTGGGNPGPLPPAAGGAVRAGDDLVAAIDEYLRSIAQAQRQEALTLKETLRTMRANADSFRNAARAGNSPAALRPRATDLLGNFNTANAIYTNLLSLDRRFNSPLFAKIADATNRVQQSVR